MFQDESLRGMKFMQFLLICHRLSKFFKALLLEINLLKIFLKFKWLFVK